MATPTYKANELPELAEHDIEELECRKRVLDDVIQHKKKQRMDATAANNMTLQQKNDALKKERDAAYDACEAANAARIAANAARNAAYTERNAVMGEKNMLLDKLATADAECKSMKLARDKLQRELETAVTSNDLQGELDLANAARDAAVTEVTSLQGELETAEDEHESLKLAHDELQNELDNAKAQLESIEERDLKFTAMNESQCVKFNVGGTRITTTLATLSKAKSAYFASLLGRSGGGGERHEVIFLDRNPELFAMVLNYLRGGPHALVALRASQLYELRKEADFYEIDSLRELLLPLAASPLQWPSLQSVEGGAVTLILNDTLAVNQRMGGGSCVQSALPFSSSCKEMSVKIVKGRSLFVGVAPREFMTQGKTLGECGWHLSTANGSFRSCDARSHADKPIPEGSIVTVRMDQENSIRFLVDGKDWGQAFKRVGEAASSPGGAAKLPPLYLCVTFGVDPNSNLQAVNGIVQLLEQTSAPWKRKKMVE